MRGVVFFVTGEMRGVVFFVTGLYIINIISLKEGLKQVRLFSFTVYAQVRTVPFLLRRVNRPD
jgi:hypothetical protein